MGLHQVQQQGQSWGARWEAAAGLLGVHILLPKSCMGFLAPVQEEILREGTASRSLCPATHWRCLEDTTLKTMPYGLRLVIPSQVFSVLGSMQPPLSWRKRKPQAFLILFTPFFLGEPLKETSSMGIMAIRSS